ALEILFGALVARALGFGGSDLFEKADDRGVSGLELAGQLEIAPGSHQIAAHERRLAFGKVLLDVGSPGGGRYAERESRKEELREEFHEMNLPDLYVKRKPQLSQKAILLRPIVRAFPECCHRIRGACKRRRWGAE